MDAKQFIILTVRFEQEDKKTWTARCQELGVSTFAPSFEEVKEDIKEAVYLFLDTLEDVGEMKRFLKEHNIKIHTKRPPKTVQVDMPVDEDSCTYSFIQHLNSSPQFEAVRA